MTKKFFFYSLTLPTMMPPGASCHLQPTVFYFATQKKLDRWKSKNPAVAANSTWGMHEISLDCAKDLVKLSKKKVKLRCQECGK